MPDPDTISADYTLRPSEVAATLKVLIEAKQPVMVWGPPGCAKSEVAQQVAAETARIYYDVRGLLLDPVDLRGIPWRDADDRTRWAPPEFLPPTASRDMFLVTVRFRFVDAAATVTTELSDPPPPPQNKPVVTVKRRPDGAPHIMVQGGKAIVRVEGWQQDPALGTAA